MQSPDSSPAVPEAAITDEAIEAAAEAEWKLGYGDTRPWSTDQDLAHEYRKAAQTALSAALPHIREHIAQEIEAMVEREYDTSDCYSPGCVEVVSRGREAGKKAAAIVRGTL